MTRYVTSDLHIGHERIIELCDRPFDNVAEMNEALVDGINSTLHPERDDLWIVGDICMGRMEDSLAVLGRIRCRRMVLIPGNHDRWSLAYHTKGDHATKRQAWRMRYANACVGVKELVYAMRDRQPSVWHVQFGGRSVSVSHYPWSGDSHGEDRYTELRPVEHTYPGLLIHGHVHTQWQTNGRQFNVGVDVNGFKPVSEHLVAEWGKAALLETPPTEITVEGYLADSRRNVENAMREMESDE